MRRLHFMTSLVLSAALCLSACGGAPTPTEAPEMTPEPTTAPRFDVPGEESAAQPVVYGEADGLEGNYYNDYLRLTLSLDGRGNCVLHSAESDEEGAYRRASDGALALVFGERRENAAVDADGDIMIDGRTGYFLRDWALWGITEAEAGIAPPEETEAPQADAGEAGDGTLRWRDYETGVALTYPAAMSLLRDTVVGGVAVRDARRGSVVARNVTDIYLTHAGSDDEFLLDYARNFVFADFATLYGELDSYEGLTALHEGVEGRLAAVTMTLKRKGSDGETETKALLYTSTYADGTVNYICKTVFAPPGGVEALEHSVTDVGAVRLVPEN